MTNARHLTSPDEVYTVYEIGPFRLDPVAGVLTRVGVAEALGPRGVAVLTALVQNAREPVTKNALMRAAWPGLVVEDANLSVQISSIRRVLAQVPGGERWLETLARRGYRFIGPVIELRDGQPHPTQPDRSMYLPEPLTSFVGRERELVELKRLLAKNRLLTLAGAGGIGKTRLALQLVAEVKDAYRDGVWFVDFAPLDDPALVPTVAAQALDVRQLVGKPLIDALRRRVEGQRMLLIFDNCEHVVDAAAHLSEQLLLCTPEPTIVATSREPLRIGGEQVYRLSTLSLPDPTANLESIQDCDSVLLFVDRAQHQQHDFALTPASGSSVARLCVRLDGIPFALELAAALVPMYAVDEINARLDDRFSLLTDGSRTALPRQQTLRATLDWSYELLSDRERAILRRASLFPSGFTLEAAVVLTNATIGEAEVPDLVMQLASRSLLVSDNSDASPRFRLLETTRAYARDKLDEANETAATQRRHAHYFRDLLRSAADAWLRLPDADWRARYLPEIDNVRSALDWSLGVDGDAALAVGLAGGSGPMWTSLSLYGEGIERLEAASEKPTSDAPPSDEARLWLWLGVLTEMWKPARAVEAFERAIEIYRKLEDPQGLAQATALLAHPLAMMGSYEGSAKALAEAQTALDRCGLPKLRAFYFANAGYLKAKTNDLENAKTFHETASSLYRELGNTVAAAAALGNVADASWALGDLAGAETAFREAAAMHRNSGHRGNDPLGFALGNLAGVLTERGKLTDALGAAREGLPLLSNAGNVWLVIDHLALRAALAGQFVNAAKVAGFADSAHAIKDATRGPNEARARARLQALLSEQFDVQTLKQLFAAGTKMSDNEACRIALDD